LVPDDVTILYLASQIYAEYSGNETIARNNFNGLSH